MSARDPIARRAEGLEVLLAERAPGLVRWLPLIGVALGIAVGAVVWLLVGSEIVLLREAVLALGGIVGLGAGLIERSRFGRLLLADNSAEPPLDLPAEFRDVPRPFDHRADAMARRDRF